MKKTSLRGEPDMGCAPLRKIAKSFIGVPAAVLSVLNHTADKRSGSVLIQGTDGNDYLLSIVDGELDTVLSI